MHKTYLSTENFKVAPLESPSCLRIKLFNQKSFPSNPLSTLNIKSFPYSSFFTLLLNNFYLMKDHATMFSPEETVEDFVYLMIFICNVFTHLYSEMSQDPLFHLKLRHSISSCTPLINQL